MFVETYYDERNAIPASTGEPPIPYPELSGEAKKGAAVMAVPVFGQLSAAYKNDGNMV